MINFTLMEAKETFNIVVPSKLNVVVLPIGAMNVYLQMNSPLG